MEREGPSDRPQGAYKVNGTLGPKFVRVASCNASVASQRCVRFGDGWTRESQATEDELCVSRALVRLPHMQSVLQPSSCIVLM